MYEYPSFDAPTTNEILEPQFLTRLVTCPAVTNQVIISYIHVDQTALAAIYPQLY